VFQRGDFVISAGRKIFGEVFACSADTILLERQSVRSENSAPFRKGEVASYHYERGYWQRWEPTPGEWVDIMEANPNLEDRVARVRFVAKGDGAVVTPV
jgi:hypothetical protein